MDGEHYKADDYQYAANIRLSVFLITGLCAGLPALIWAVRSLHQLQGSGVRVSVFIASLLFSDALEFPLIPAIVSNKSLLHFTIFTLMPIAVRHFGFCLHQLVALEGILSLRNPLCPSCLSSRFVSIPLAIILGICAATVFFVIPHIILCVFTFTVAGITCVLACKVSCSVSYTDMSPALQVTVIAMFTLAFLYLPFIVITWTCWFMFASAGCFDSQPWIMSLSIMSIRLIADPLLCVLVCRKILTSISHAKLHNDQGTV